MARDVKAQRLFFRPQHLNRGPGRRAWQRHLLGSGRFLATEEIILPQRARAPSPG